MTEQNAAPQTGATVKGYRTLSSDEVARMNELKRISALFLTQLEIVQKSVQAQYQKSVQAQYQNAHSEEGDAEQLRLDDADPFRWLAMAKTDMQHACMFACRAVAQPDGNS